MTSHPFVPWVITRVVETPTGRKTLYGDRWIPVVEVTMPDVRTICARCSWNLRHPCHA